MKHISQVIAEPDPDAELVRSLMDYAQTGYGFTDSISSTTSNDSIESMALEAACAAAEAALVPLNDPAVGRVWLLLVDHGVDHREGLLTAKVVAAYAHLEEPSDEALGLAP